MVRLLIRPLLAAFLATPGVAQEAPKYEARGATLVRIEGSTTTTLECTDPEGTGTIHDVARGPFGTVYVAAQRGLFSVADSVRHLTPLPRQLGAPKGTPLALHVDRRGTIWLGTDEAFGCVEPVHLFGQTISTSAGSLAGKAPAVPVAICPRLPQLHDASATRG